VARFSCRIFTQVYYSHVPLTHAHRSILNVMTMQNAVCMTVGQYCFVLITVK